MSDPRPSENTEDIPQWSGFRAAGFFDDAPKSDDEQDPIADLIERAENAHDHTLGLVFAQLATVRAVQAQTEQLRLANLVAVVGITARTGIAIGEYDVLAVEAAIREGLDL